MTKYFILVYYKIETSVKAPKRTFTRKKFTMPSASSKRESCEIQYAYTDDGVRYIAVRYKSGKTDILTQAEYRRLYPIQQQGTKETRRYLRSQSGFWCFGFIP